ncbi:hypothetical protein C8Q75DRAFT_756623 [Abortiporus biennis]|nr:hypothetical protein C8Q75DRAFT_756623 [Abortiporus biennis]
MSHAMKGRVPHFDLFSAARESSACMKVTKVARSKSFRMRYGLSPTRRCGSCIRFVTLRLR